MGVGIFWIGLNPADLGCWRLTLKVVKPARCKRYFYIANRNKRSVFLLNDHFVISECKLCNKEWKPLAML